MLTVCASYSIYIYTYIICVFAFQSDSWNIHFFYFVFSFDLFIFLFSSVILLKKINWLANAILFRNGPFSCCIPINTKQNFKFMENFATNRSSFNWNISACILISGWMEKKYKINNNCEQETNWLTDSIQLSCISAYSHAQ